jgi:hypothetical protein
MKKIYLMAALFAANLSMAQQGFESIISISGSETYWDGSDLTGTSNGAGLFDSTFSEGNFEFSNQYDTTWGLPGYWSAGWAFSNQTSDTLTGLTGQYSSYAGGASFGSNYALGFNNTSMMITDTSNAITSIVVANSNYAAHSMLDGDFYAKQFGSAYSASGNLDGTNGEDWFLMTIVGYDVNGNAKDSVEFYLADYRFSNSSQDYIIKDWTNIDVSPLGVVSSIKFKLSSSDVGQYGMNTPAIFAIDNINYFPVSVQEQSIENIKIYPNPTNDILSIDVSGECSAELFDLSGKLVMTKTITTANNQISLLDFPKGIYQLVIATENTLQTTKIVKL